MHIVSEHRGKRRKAHFNAPQELKWKMMSSKFSEEMATQYGVKRFPIHSGDQVKVMVGQFKGKIGKVIKIDRSAMRVHVENCTVNKGSGGVAQYPIHPSNLMIIKLEMDENRENSINKAREIRERIKARHSLKQAE